MTGAPDITKPLGRHDKKAEKNTPIVLVPCWQPSPSLPHLAVFTQERKCFLRLKAAVLRLQRFLRERRSFQTEEELECRCRGPPVHACWVFSGFFLDRCFG